MPLDSLHPQARRASEAARCAGDQGKFWEYHDKLYAGGPDVSPEYLQKLATDIGLDVAGFEQCLGSAKHLPGVQRDLQEATALGLTGTPAFFVNGRPLSGAQPVEAFVQIIEQELRPAAARRTASFAGVPSWGRGSVPAAWSARRPATGVSPCTDTACSPSWWRPRSSRWSPWWSPGGCASRRSSR